MRLLEFVAAMREIMWFVLAVPIAIFVALVVTDLILRVPEYRRKKLSARADEWAARAREARAAAVRDRELGLEQSAVSQEQVAELYRTWARELRPAPANSAATRSRRPAPRKNRRPRGIRPPGL